MAGLGLYAGCMRIEPEISRALAAGRPVVALESTVITHGLPRPLNLETARKLEAAVRQEGALPATLAILKGEPRIGLSPEDLEYLALDQGAEKASQWNLAALAAQGKNAGTTVAATALLAHQAGIQVFATGGIGGVHYDAYDESGDLFALAHTPLVVVASGPKSILNLSATLERLETYGVSLAGYRTGKMPAFHSSESPFLLPARAETPEEAARIFLAAKKLLASSLLLMNPVSEGLEYAQVQAWVQEASQQAARAGVQGKALTPFLLRKLSELSGGETDRVNLLLLEENARLAARVALALSRLAASTRA